jgi:predicted dehydrogenase
MVNEIARIGIVGMGKMGLLHAAIFNALPNSRVVAIAEPAEMQRQALGKFNPRIDTFENIERMLDDCPVDAVVIATPVVDHVPSALLCMRKGIPFFMEKPLATSTEQAKDLVQCLSRSPLLNMVGFMLLFVGSFALAKTIISSGCLGQLRRVTGTIYVSQLFTRGKGWRYDRQISGGGVLLSQGSHLLDLLTWYFGPVARVNADVLSVYSPDIEDFAHLFLEFRSGLRCWVDSSWSVRGRRVMETHIEALGDNGVLLINDDTLQMSLDAGFDEWKEGQTVWRATDLFQPVPFDVGGPQFTREDLAFLDALRLGSIAAPDVLQAYHVQAIVDAAYASSQQSGVPRQVEYVD